MAQLVITGQRLGPARLERMRFAFRYHSLFVQRDLDNVFACRRPAVWRLLG